MELAGIVTMWDQYFAVRSRQRRDALVLHYAGLVKYVAGRVRSGLPEHAVGVAELASGGMLGLIDAVERFDPTKGAKFETYANQRIRGSIIDQLRRDDWVPRSVRDRERAAARAIEDLGGILGRTPTTQEVATHVGSAVSEIAAVSSQVGWTVTLDDPRTARSLANRDLGADPAEIAEAHGDRQMLRAAIAKLNDQSRRVLGLYYFEGLTLAEIGSALHVTESRVCQVHTKALHLLRERLLREQGTEAGTPPPWRRSKRTALVPVPAEPVLR